MHALIGVAVTVGVGFVSIAALLGVWADLHARLEVRVVAPADDDEGPYGDTSAIPGFVD